MGIAVKLRYIVS